MVSVMNGINNEEHNAQLYLLLDIVVSPTI